MKTLPFFLFLIFSSIVYASSDTHKTEDTYILKYNSKDNNCSLIKNGVTIPVFDARFKQKEPKNSYTCSAIQKEQYNYCHVVDSKNTTAQVFAYGAYEFTNLVISFRNPSKSVDSFMKIECTKKTTHK